MHPQQINLYKHFAPQKPKTDILNWKQYWVSNVVVAVILILSYLTSFSELYYKNVDIKEQINKIANYKLEFEKLKSTYPKTFFSENIDKSVSQLKKNISSQEQIIRILANKTLFSDDLEALSNTIIPDVWLTKINIIENGDQINLTGNSVGTVYLNKFINNLGVNTVFSQYKIDIKSAKNQKSTDEESKGSIKFELEIVANT